MVNSSPNAKQPTKNVVTEGQPLFRPARTFESSRDVGDRSEISQRRNMTYVRCQSCSSEVIANALFLSEGSVLSERFGRRRFAKC